jgi:hypothetical protein
MKALFNTLPVIGVLWGALAYAYQWRLWPIVVIVGVAIAAAAVGRRQAATSPVLAIGLIECSGAAAVAMMALATWAGVWIALHAKDLFSGAAPDVRQTVAGALSGAAATYIATLVTKGIESGEGSLWPSAQFRSALADAFRDKPGQASPLPRDTRVFEAAFSPFVRADANGRGAFNGWGLEARWTRAYILRDFLSPARP